MIIITFTTRPLFMTQRDSVRRRRNDSCPHVQLVLELCNYQINNGHSRVDLLIWYYSHKSESDVSEWLAARNRSLLSELKRLQFLPSLTIIDVVAVLFPLFSYNSSLPHDWRLQKCFNLIINASISTIIGFIIGIFHCSITLFISESCEADRLHKNCS